MKSKNYSIMPPMKKYLKITLISFLTLVILLTGLLFTQTGNDIAKPYLKAELEKQTGLPVEVDMFKLRYDHTELKIVVNDALTVNIISIFNLLNLSFDGTYTLYANNFVYDGISLKGVSVNGEFKGIPSDILVNGKGTSFKAPLNYYLRILDGDAKEISINLKNMNLANILALSKQPPLAKGLVDANITIPTLLKGELNAHGKILFNGITFNDNIMKKVYKISVPEAMKMNGTVDANLSNTQVMGSIDMQSNVANINLKDVHFDRETKHISSHYIIDIMNLKSLSDLLRTKMDGAIILEGHLAKEKTLKITGLTKSLGGEINYKVLDKNFSASIEAVPVKNMLSMFRFPAFVNADASGNFDYHLQNKIGNIQLALEDFRLTSNTVTKSIKMMIQKDPASIVFGETSLNAAINGDEINYTLMAKALDASISINNAIINKDKDTHDAKIEFAYNKYAIKGNIGGSIREPRVGFDATGFVPDTDFLPKAEKKIKKFFKRLF